LPLGRITYVNPINKAEAHTFKHVQTRSNRKANCQLPWQAAYVIRPVVLNNVMNAGVQWSLPVIDRAWVWLWVCVCAPWICKVSTAVEPKDRRKTPKEKENTVW